MAAFAHLNAFTAGSPVTVWSGHSVVAGHSREGGMGIWTHHDLGRAPSTAPHLSIRACGPRWVWHAHSFKLNPLHPDSSFTQHVSGFCRNSWYAGYSMGLWAWVGLFPEFDFLPEGDEKDEKQNDDKGKDSNANYLSWSDVRQWLSLCSMKRKIRK